MPRSWIESAQPRSWKGHAHCGQLPPGLPTPSLQPASQQVAEPGGPGPQHIFSVHLRLPDSQQTSPVSLEVLTPQRAFPVCLRGPHCPTRLPINSQGPDPQHAFLVFPRVLLFFPRVLDCLPTDSQISQLAPCLYDSLSPDLPSRVT